MSHAEQSNAAVHRQRCTDTHDVGLDFAMAVAADEPWVLGGSTTIWPGGGRLREVKTRERPRTPHPWLVINSRSGNVEPRQLLLASLPPSLRARALVVVGNSSREGILRQEPPDGVWHLEVKQNTVDFTALVALEEHRALLNATLWSAQGSMHEDREAPPGFLLLHDTCRAGPRFQDLLQQQVFDNRSRLLSGDAFLPTTSRNMGYYSNTMLRQMHTTLMRWRSTDNPSGDDAGKIKRLQIGAEGLLFRVFCCKWAEWQRARRNLTSVDQAFFFRRGCHKGPSAPLASALSRAPSESERAFFQYSSPGSVPRLVRHYEGLDLFKFAANYQLISRHQWSQGKRYHLEP